MAISVKTIEEDIVGRTRMVTGSIMTDGTSEGSFSTGLTAVSSIMMTPSPAVAVTTSGGTVTTTPVIATTPASGTITLTGASGSIDSVTIGGVEVIVDAVAFDTDVTDTATALAVEINLNTSSYVATSTLGVVTITADYSEGADANGTVIVSTTTTLVGADVDLADGVSNAIYFTAFGY